MMHVKRHDLNLDFFFPIYLSAAFTLLDCDSFSVMGGGKICSVVFLFFVSFATKGIQNVVFCDKYNCSSLACAALPFKVVYHSLPFCHLPVKCQMCVWIP